ncbi:Rossmann-like and DUF2520 domain-containing protein [Actinocorallia longicatena]|uniref:Short-subunit dehydrogenase-like oxidoreductase (DUF2520 family) n=1 Tax=Actinocorallia longicatena TaxID=111803 RepID=A0ABP6QPH6_9ACTN
MNSPTERPGRLRVGIVGAGRVGAVLGAALARAGHRVVAASAVSSRDRAAELLPGVPFLAPQEVVEAAELVLLTVPDDALADLAAGLVAADVNVRGRLFAHACGRYGIAVLEPLTRAGGLPLALHPVMTFAGRPDDLDRLAGISFGVTAPGPLRPVGEALVVEMGADPVWIEEEHRTLYHAALAIGANHLVTLVVEASGLLTRAGVEEPSRLLGPLLGAALDNALRLGAHGLTGPVARGDAGTVADHVAAVGAASPEALAAYLAMARRTADLALDAGLLKPESAERLLGALHQPRE